MSSHLESCIESSSQISETYDEENITQTKTNYQDEIRAYVTKFKKEVEFKYNNSDSNKNYRFQKNEFCFSKENSCDSLENVLFYDLESQNMKRELQKCIGDKKKSETTILVEIISKLGKLDSRYLNSQLQNVKSPLFCILASGFQNKVKKNRVLISQPQIETVVKKSIFNGKNTILEKRPIETNKLGKSSFNMEKNKLIHQKSPEKSTSRSVTRLFPQLSHLSKNNQITDVSGAYSNRINPQNQKPNQGKQSIDRDNSQKRLPLSQKSLLISSKTSPFVQKQPYLEMKGSTFNSLIKEMRKEKKEKNASISRYCSSNRSASKSKVLQGSQNFKINLNNRPNQILEKNTATLTKAQLRNLIHNKIYQDSYRLSDNTQNLPSKIVQTIALKTNVQAKKSGRNLGTSSFWEKFKFIRPKLI